MRVAGLILAGAGGVLALRSALLLSGRGRPRRGSRPAFVLAGPYLRIRNPLLVGLLAMLAGLALVSRSWLALAATLGAAAAAHHWVVRTEEPRLRDRFGDAYVEYLRRVPRWVPRRDRARRRGGR